MAFQLGGAFDRGGQKQGASDRGQLTAERLTWIRVWEGFRYINSIMIMITIIMTLMMMMMMTMMTIVIIRTFASCDG